jgi:energy-coupling factor transporter ATP-binding protein EcfA2
MEVRMIKVIIDLENCYGIKKLKTEFDFSQHKVYAIYAANGAMKTSLAQTFNDIAEASASKDRIFPDRVNKRDITDENNVPLPKENIVVIRPYDDGVIGHTEKTSTLLVDRKLRKEYEELHIEINKSKEIFLKALKEESGSKKDLEKEISSVFTKNDDKFYRALIRVRDEVLAQKDAPFASVNYDTIFDEKVLSFLRTENAKTAIENYIKKYNELLAASIYFKKGVFNYFNAETIAKNLAVNGFFAAEHTINLNADEKLEITNQKQLEELIKKEKDGITNDDELRKTFLAIEKLIQKNKAVRGFEAYLGEHEELLTELANIESFKEKIWKSYFKAQVELYIDLIEQYQAAEKRKGEIEEEASKQRTQWETVIEIFNKRFFVPFKLTAKNRVSVILGQEPILNLAFTFEDGVDQAPIEKSALMEALSTGEKRAFYILNIIFEVEARKKAKQETIFVVDDIADSFDYKNKYAIIQYLKDIDEEPYFNQIILTHNFDFFRTIESRFVAYPNCLMALKNNDGISLVQATGIRNVFVNDWKPNFFTDPKKKISSIPFIRNLVEYTKGDKDPDYIKLTSLLHWKSDSIKITEKELGAIYTSVFSIKEEGLNGTSLMIELIEREADECLNADAGINFENKIVLAIAIRIFAEKFMVGKINDTKFVNSIESNQTHKLLDKFRVLFPDEVNILEIIQRVILMTPENIHLNSFMYEPILDMSDDHLKSLYKEVKDLK